MSLINEALKRAKAAQENAPPPALSAAHLHPVDPTHTAQHTAGLMLPIILTLVALGGLFLLWRASQVNVSAKAPTPAPQPAAFATPSPESPKPLLASASAAVSRAAEPPVSANPPAPTATATSTQPAPTPSTATNLAALPSPPLPKPAALRLQGIVYDPLRPSAMIGGKTLFVGDRIGEFRVMAITQETATLAGATRTNVLILAE